MRKRFSAHCSLLPKAISVAGVLALVSLGRDPATLVRYQPFIEALETVGRACAGVVAPRMAAPRLSS